MKKLDWTITVPVILLVLLMGCEQRSTAEQNWTHYVRTSGHGLSLGAVDDIIKGATETHLFGIEVDNSLTGYYESFLDPTAKLEAINAVVAAAHAAGHRIFLYTEGLETITSDADQKEHTFFKDHPDWVQRNIAGEPAIFGGESAFWIREGDEDVWISPYAQEWRDLYMERVRQIAGTGIDGVYVDIPYWMTHFDGWEDSWASFDDYTVAAFRKQTGLNAKTDIRLGDMNDPAFIQWINFRIRSITDFMADVDRNAKSVNPKCMTIAEIYPGIDESAVRVGSDVYELYEVVDVIAHEYNEGGYTAANRSPIHWFEYMTGMFTFRSFAQGKASWMLSYSWDGEENIEPRQAMENMFLSQIMAGTNPWDARGHVMSGSNDYAARTEIFKWIGEHEKTFYLPRESVDPIGVYFSPVTRNFFPRELETAYKGIMYQLLQTHTEFQIVTPRTLGDFQGQVLILPEVKCVSDEEVALFSEHFSKGVTLVVTGETGKYNAVRQHRETNPVHAILGIDPAEGRKISTGDQRFIFIPECPGGAYYKQAHQEFNSYAERGEYLEAPFYRASRDFVREVLQVAGMEPAVQVDTSPFVASQIARVDSRLHVFLANFTGLVAKERAVPIPVENVTISFPGKASAKVHLLPFLGEMREIAGQWQDGVLTVVIPEIQRGAVVWLNE